MLTTLTLAAITTLGCATGQSTTQDGTALTIYSTATPGAVPAEMYRPVQGSGGYTGRGWYNQIPGYAVVRQDRTLDIERGVSELSFTGVAALLDPTTVRFESLTDPDGTSVLDQAYKYDLVSTQRLFERYIDKTIEINRVDFTVLSIEGDRMLLQDPSGSVVTREGTDGVVFPALDESLVTRPTLSWTVAADQGGTHATRVSYQTTGITWWADYNLLFTPGDDANSGTVDLGAWVSILNQSGGSYRDASLKLVAGDVHRPDPVRKNARMERLAYTADGAGQGGFEEKSFFEYHLYTLGRPVSIPDRSTKQIELFEQVRQVPAQKVLVYDTTAPFVRANTRWGGREHGLNTDAKVAVFLEFENSEDNGLGIPLPSGRVRVNQADEADGAHEFIGEDIIDHTPREERVSLKLGNAFDVVGERRQTAFESGKNWMLESIEVKIRNRKNADVDVIVREHLYRWVNARVTEISHEHKMADARTLEVPLTLAPDEEAVVTYTVRYDWE